MAGIHAVFEKNPYDYHSIMMWAACCLAFFGFLRSSEFTVPSQEAFDKDIHLLSTDLAIDNKANPQLLTVKIKQSKTGPFRQGVTLGLGRTASTICQITAILPFLAMRGDQPGPLFILRDGRMLTRKIFSTSLDNILDKLHLSCDYFNTHSFWIGQQLVQRKQA